MTERNWSIRRGSRSENASFTESCLEVLDIVQLGKRLPSIEDLVVARGHLRVGFIRLANTWITIYRLKLPTLNAGRQSVFDDRRIQHDSSLVENEL